MAFLDSSVIIDYLNGVEDIVVPVDEAPRPHLTSAICVYEVLAGEVFSSGSTDIERARNEFGRVDTVAFDESTAVAAARLQDRLRRAGSPLSPRDLVVAASARSLGEPLFVSDGDFVTTELTELMAIRRLPPDR